MKSLTKLMLAGILALSSGCSYDYKPVYDNNIGYEILKIEGKKNNKAYLNLDQLIGSAEKKIKKREKYSAGQALDVFRIIHHLLKEQGYKFKDTNMLTDALTSKDRFIDCDTYSYLYLSIADALDLPIVSVCSKNHMFLRWMFPNGAYINFEPTAGDMFNDSFYIKRHNISKEAIENGIYLKSMDKAELLSSVYIQASLGNKKDSDKKLDSLEKALQLDPKNTVAYFSKGVELYHLGRYEEAIESFNWGLELDPGESKAYCLRAMARYQLGDEEGFKEDINKSKQTDKDNPFPYSMQGMIYLEKKEWKKAEIAYDEAIKREKKPSYYFERSTAKENLGDKKGAKEDKLMYQTLKRSSSKR